MSMRSSDSRAVATNGEPRTVTLMRAVLWLYQACVSPFLSPACRFAPTCSAYADEALHRYGVRRGGWMAMRRLLRCHPWHPGGWDPVR
jgi:hypothetical protein